MGEVWVAKQTKPVKRKVAIKLVKTGMDSREVLKRFEQERQALALMGHPNIARVLDGGLTPTGQPFFVMELVNGLPLNEFCDKARLTPKDRLRLFVRICQAVQHAHQKGIVHRDLKPGNILVTIIDGRPVPKVIDFGVAKATAGKLTNESMSTQFGAVVGTLEYMSPEQAGFSGDDIDTRADIYSLGVILYEMLTGLKPIDASRLKNAALVEMIRMIRDDEPSKPSTRLSSDDALPSLAAIRQTDPKKLMALLRGELDWVVMKCLEKQRDRRYETANALARDIQRYLTDEPVEARPPSAKYRLNKFLKRNKGQVIAASLIFLTVLAGVVGTAVGLTSADQARRQAAVEATARATAEKARDEVEEAREQLARVEYGRTVEMAHQEWRDNNVDAARALLESTRSDLRGWEWQYVHRLCHSTLLTIGGSQVPANIVSLSPDGTRIVAHGGDLDETTATVWDSRSGEELATLRGHTDHLTQASFSPDSSRIVTGSWDKTARVWDAKTGAATLTLKGHTGKVSSCSFNPNGSQIVTSSEDKTIKVWAAETGALLYTLKGGIYDYGPPFSPDGSRIVGWDPSGPNVEVWDSKSGAEVYKLKGHTKAISSVIFSRDGARVLTASIDGTAKVWDAQTGAEILTLRAGPDVRFKWAFFNPDASQIVTAGVNRHTARVWNSNTGTEALTLSGHTSYVTSAAFSSDGKRIITSSMDKTTRVWDAKTGADVLTLRGHTAPVGSASFTPDGSRIVTSGIVSNSFGVDRSVMVWDANRDAEVFTFKTRWGNAYAAFSPDGNRLVIASQGAPTTTVWDANTGTEVLILKRNIGPIMPASFSPDGSRIITDSVDKTAKVWDANTGDELLTLKGHTDFIWSACFSPDGSRIVTSSEDETTKVWDAKTAVELLTWPGALIFSSASFSPDGSQFVGAVPDKPTAEVWDMQTGNKALTLKGHTDAILSASFSPDSPRIVTGSRDSTAKVWDAQTGEELFTLKGHTGQIVSASFSPGGSRILTASWDGTAKLWDARTGIQVLTLKGHDYVILSASFSPDESRIVTSTQDGKVRIWDARPINRQFLTPNE